MCFPIGSYVKLCWQSSWIGPGPTRRNFERGPPNDCCDQAWFKLPRWFQRGRSLNVFLQRVQCQFGGHVGLDLDLPDVLMNVDHSITIVTKFGSNWPSSFYGEDLWMYFPEGLMLNYIPRWGPSWIEPRPAGHDLERGLSKDYCDQVWLQLDRWFQRRRSLNVFPHSVQC